MSEDLKERIEALKEKHSDLVKKLDHATELRAELSRIERELVEHNNALARDKK